jgi:hypothetical protein
MESFRQDIENLIWVYCAGIEGLYDRLRMRRFLNRELEDFACENTFNEVPNYYFDSDSIINSTANMNDPEWFANARTEQIREKSDWEQMTKLDAEMGHGVRRYFSGSRRQKDNSFHQRVPENIQSQGIDAKFMDQNFEPLIVKNYLSPINNSKLQQLEKKKMQKNGGFADTTHASTSRSAVSTDSPVHTYSPTREMPAERQLKSSASSSKIPASSRINFRCSKQHFTSSNTRGPSINNNPAAGSLPESRSNREIKVQHRLLARFKVYEIDSRC